MYKVFMARQEWWAQIQSLHEYNRLDQAIINTFKK